MTITKKGTDLTTVVELFLSRPNTLRLNIKQEKEIKTKINTSIEKFDEDSFDCGNVTYILNI